MQYIINNILETIANREPASGSETIILVNGFDKLEIYAGLAMKLKEIYDGSTFSLNVKLAKRKWDELVKTSDTTTIQQMLQNNWVAKNESVTFYRNQHNFDILVLLGTENEEDTGGLANCFTITPTSLVNNLDGNYHKIFDKCFINELSDDDIKSVNAAYSALFEYCPINICHLSDIADEWFGEFDTINEFCEEYGKKLPEWGLPGKVLKPFKPQNFRKKINFLHDEMDFISGKMFQRMSQKAYKSLMKKIDEYKDKGEYANVDWADYGFNGYHDFAAILLEFARGEKVQQQREKLLKVDFTIIEDILKFKLHIDPKPSKNNEKTISGEPINVVLRTTLNVLKNAKNNELDDVDSVHFDFSSASIVTGYTDIDDEEKWEILEEAWKNICIHVNGLFEFININTWKFFGKQISIECDTPDFFNPQKVAEQISNTVNVVSGTNTLNKIVFTVKALNKDGITVIDSKDIEQKELSDTYVWKFENEAAWLYDFKSLTDFNCCTDKDDSRIPIGVMQHIKNAMFIKGEEEFFDFYDENLPDLSYDVCEFVRTNAEKSQNYELKQIGVMFTDLGKVFCGFVANLSNFGFYHVLCSDILTDLNDKYKTVADKILKTRLDENKQWVKDAFLQAFVILDRTSYIIEDVEPDCIIVPPWHPAALQKIADQKRFLIDGVCQINEEFDTRHTFFDIDGTIDRFTRMTEIQSSLDLFPANGNDYMGILGSYGHFCVYGDEKNTSSVTTRMKDILRKEEIFDDEFKATELTKMNDDAKMIYDILLDYNKAMPSVKSSLSIVFINPPNLQPIIAAVSKYTKEILADDEEANINIKLSILVRPENKGGKNYLTYWMNDYFSEENNNCVRVYLNEWSKKAELDRLLSDNNDIVFNMDLLHAATFKFTPNVDEFNAKISDCRFPIVYKPSPLSKTSKKRKIEITQTQFSAAYKHTQIVRYKKNPEVIPQEAYLAIRETTVEEETKSIIDMLHKKAYWVVCIDKVMDGALLRTDTGNDTYAIIGFSTGKGMYGQYNLTITARNSILETVEVKLKNKLQGLFKWKTELLDNVVKNVMNQARSLDGISVLSAINQKGTNINEFMAYVMTALRERQNKIGSALKVIIHLDSYKHWFDNSDNDESSMRPDFLMLSVVSIDKIIKLKATVIECKTASYNNHQQHVEKAKIQVQHGLEQLQRLFDPNTRSIERRYWYAQLYRALVFAQVTFSDSSDEFELITSKLRSILDGNFEIEWNGIILGYWFDLTGSEEMSVKEDGITICNIPQECIQKLLTSKPAVNYVDVDKEILDELDDTKEEERERNFNQVIKDKRNEMINRKRKATNSANEQKQLGNNNKRQDAKTTVTQGRSEEDKPVDTAKLQGNTNVVPYSEQTEKADVEHAKNINDLRVLIGKDRSGYDVYWEFGNKGLANRHLLITGTSGQGKTYGIQTMLYELSKSNVSMVVFDYTEGFRADQLEKKFLAKMEGRIDNRVVYVTGVPIDPFKRHELEVAGIKVPEKISDVAQRIASTLTHVYKFGDQQFAAIYEACTSGLTKYGDNMTMQLLEKELNASANKSAKSVVSKMMPFLHSVEFSDERCNWDDILYNETGKLTIFQLTNFVRDIQVIITEFMLWDMWHFTKKNGNKDKPFVVVLDEAQNLSHAENSPSCLILTEGRKFGWSAWYATQSLKVLDNDEVTRLLQSAFKLYFKPTDDEIISIAKQLNPTDANEWRKPLINLKKGECIVVGDRIQKDDTFKSGRPTITKVTSFDERE